MIGDFIRATKEGNYKYWLQASDISDIADVIYNCSNENKDVYFCITGSFAHLVKELSEYKEQRQKKLHLTFTSIINLGGQHWVTLVVKYYGNKYRGYYCESFGDTLSETSCSDKISNSTDDLVTQTIIIVSILSFALSLVMHSTILSALSFICIAICGLFLYLTSKTKEKINHEVTTTLVEEYKAVIELTEGCYDNMITSLETQAAKERENGMVVISNNIDTTIQLIRKQRDKVLERQLNTNTIPIALQAILGMDRNNIKSSWIKQQEDGCNCGIYALINAKTITDNMFNNDSLFNKIDAQLQKNTLTPEQLRAKREEFKENLSKNEEQNLHLAPVSVLSQTTEIKQPSDSLGVHK